MKVNLVDLENIIVDKLNEGGSVTFSPRGTSMLPMLVEGEDTITLVKVNRKIRKYDVIFYKRDDGAYVLHRVVKIKKDGYVLRGDNQYINEYGIKDDMVIGILSSYTKKDRQYSIDTFRYKLYCRFWVNTKLIRRILNKIKHLFRRKKGC